MKKTLMTVIAVLFAMCLLENASAQSVILDSLAADGTRIVQYKTKGVCSSMIEVHTYKKKVTFLQYTGGCNGNLKGIAALVNGMKIKDVIARVDDITCGKKSTSCPDQLAEVLKYIQENKPKKRTE